MNRSDAIWGAIIGAGVAFELHAMRRELEHTLSRRTRYHFRTHHPAGKLLFAAGWTALWYWYLRHILEGE